MAASNATLLTRVSEALTASGPKPKLLADIAWPASVEQRFFEKKARELPQVEYNFDRAALTERAGSLESLAKSIDGDDPVRQWLRDTVRSYADACRLLLFCETTEFYKLSRELYGSARTRFPGRNVRNIDLARHLAERLASTGFDEAIDAPEPTLDARSFAALMTKRLAERAPPMNVAIVIDDRCTAKVIAGRERVRVRSDAMFTESEADGLWAHEVETHALTAQNGALQKSAYFLAGGGPRTTRTQEGLAIFSELYMRTLSASRMQRLARRVELVDMAEEGADFLQLYNYLIEHGSEEREAFLDAQRICRGGKLTGGAPFTKDACYLAGLVEVYAFLSVMVRGGFRDEMELLVCGRVAIDDVAAMITLRREGVLSRPKFLPPWLVRWQSLLPYFAFTSFFAELNLAAVEERFTPLVELCALEEARAKKKKRDEEEDG